MNFSHDSITMAYLGYKEECSKSGSIMTVDGFAGFMSLGRFNEADLYARAKSEGLCLRVAQICALINDDFYLSTRKSEEMETSYRRLPVEVYDDAQKLDDTCQAYFDFQTIMNKPFGVTGMAEFLGISRADIIRYLMDHSDYDVRNVIRFYLTKIESYMESKMMTGEIGIAQMKFYMTNNHDWSDKLSSESTVNQKVTTSASISSEESRQSFINLMLSVGVTQDIIDNLDF